MRKPPTKPRRLGWIAAAAAVLAALAAWVIWQYAGNDGPAGARQVPVSTQVSGAPGTGAQVLTPPLWRDLSPAQQVALAPLRPEWDGMDGLRKKKWLEMSRRFGSMNRTEQGRVHERMRQWMRLTPEQRSLARENYTRARKLAPGDKAATWESYKQLTPGEKQRLAQSAARKNAASANLPAPASNVIVAPTSCPAGTTRRGASCIALQPPASIPTAPAISQPAPASSPAPVAPPAAPPAAAPALPAPTAQPTAAPAPSNANG